MDALRTFRAVAAKVLLGTIVATALIATTARVSSAATASSGGMRGVPVMFAPKTLFHTLTSDFFEQSDGTIYVQTGDIPAMWLRDSAAQTLPYVRLAAERPMLRTWIRAVILREARNIVIDPYANAFRSNYRIWERKWEIDSLAYPVLLAWTYYDATRDRGVFTVALHRALARIVETYACERAHARCSHYRPPLGTGSAERGPAPEVGLIWSAFRASDDPTRYAYNIPEQMFAATALRDVADLASRGYDDAPLAQRAATFAGALSKAIARYGIVDEPACGGPVYAYEVDGRGEAAVFDDANLPSLLGAPLSGPPSVGDSTYRRTRACMLSTKNPYFFHGRIAAGVGSPHTPRGYVWPLALMARALTSIDPAEVLQQLSELAKSASSDGRIHESFDANDAARFTRAEFGWANAMYAELLFRAAAGAAAQPVAPPFGQSAMLAPSISVVDHDTARANRAALLKAFDQAVPMAKTPGHLLGDDVVQVRLVLDGPSVPPGGSTDATVELTPAAGWHLYGPERGDAGAPPDIAWTLPPSLRAGSIAFPQSTRVVTHGLTTYEYHGPVALRVRLSASAMAKPQRAVPIRADLTWLVCSHVCAPGRTTLDAAIDIVPAATPMPAALAPFVLLAFLGGLILNLMPCIFPVLSFKALRAIGDPLDRRWRNAGAYAAGVVVSCASLGLALIAARAAGHAIGWGFQLQSPPFVAFLALLLIVLGLGMSGVFELTIPVPVELSRRALGLGAFGDGILVTLIASACIAPYMGAALGFALSASPAAAIGIFVALGFGIAVPHATLMVVPSLLGWIPKPGRWMVTARRILALPLYASAAWLIWVFVQQVIPPPVATPNVVASAPAFSTANIADLRRMHRAVLVEVGAAWCITCQVNERFALERPEVTRRLAALGVTVVHADWTNQNPQITAYLHSLGSAGVPLYVYYRRDGAIDVWPQLLTPRSIVDRLNRA